MKAWKETVRTYYKYVIAEYNPPNPDSSSGSDGYTFSNFVGGSNDSNSRACLNDTYSGNTFSSSSAWGSSGFTVRYPKKFVVKSAKYYAHIRSGAADPSIMYYFKIEGYNYDTSSYETIVDQGGNSPDTWNEYTYTSNTLNTDLYKITFHGQRNNWGFASNLYLSGEAETRTESTSSDYDFYEDVDTYKMVKQENVRKYYKYDTSNPTYNYTPVGALVNTNGVLSGFSSSIYATIVPPFVPMSNSWEIVFKFTTGANISSEQYVFCSMRGSSGACHGIYFEIKSSKIEMAGSTNGTSWNVNTGWSSTTLATDTTYWLKGVFDGSTYKLYLSTNGTNFTQEGSTVTNSNPIYQTTVVTRIGVYGNSASYPFNGTVDLKESYINIGGGKWWQGVTYPILPATSSNYDFYQDVDVYSAFNI